MAERLDLIVIGAGPGGYVAAIRAAQLGMRVACVEKRSALGGTCLNIGCIPSKALLDSSEHYAQARNKFAEHGIQVGEVAVDLKRMMERKNRVVKGLTDGVAFLFKKHKVTSVHGAARLAGAGKVEIQAEKSTQTLEAQNILLATGSEPATLPALPFDGKSVVSSTEGLSFGDVPKHLIVVGGGYIGLELGSVWSRLGSKVAVVEFLPRIVAQSDVEIAGLLHKSLAKQGLDIRTDTKVTSATTKKGQVVVQAEAGGKKVEFEGDQVLVAVGRKPFTSGLGLEENNVKLDERTGRVVVNEAYQTSIAGIYAIGDLIAGPMLAHKAEDEGMACVEKLAGKAGQVNYAAIPSVVYTWPEAASVGQTEEQVKESGRAYRVGKFPFSANGRARCLGDTEGLVKIIADEKTDRVLGVHIFGPRASDLLPAGRQLGGAPFNFAFHCHQLGHCSVIVSRVGKDALGREIRSRLASADLPDTYVQSDADHPTGTVPVVLDDRGQPTFTITSDVAYDYLVWDERLEELLPRARAICFGTLIQRQAIARTTVQRALRAAGQALIVYDINLRQHFYNRETIEQSLRASRWLKLNDHELRILQDILKLPATSPSAALAELRQRYELDLACLTRGERGCRVQTSAEEVDMAGVPVRVIDTVGAGDAFTAGLLVYSLEGRPLREAVEFANRLAARVAASPGGTPSVRREEVEHD